MPRPTETVRGWGYEGRTVEDLLAFVRGIRAAVVVDVRLNALSRRPGFSKRALGAALRAAGVEYVHFRDLGNPRDNRPGFATPGSPVGQRAHSRFRDEVLASSEGKAALGRVARLAQSGAIVLVCFEADESQCHRSLIIDALEDVAATEPAYN